MAAYVSVTHTVSFAPSTGENQIDQTVTFVSTASTGGTFAQVTHRLNFRQKARGRTGYLASGRYRR